MLEEKDEYLYQPGLTMVGAGMKDLSTFKCPLRKRFQGMNFQVDPVIRIAPK